MIKWMVACSLGALFMYTSCTDKPVENPAFGIMLNFLLEHKAKEISVDEAVKLDNVTWLDARTREEFEVSRIPGARWVGDAASTEEIIGHHAKESPIIVYCSVGYRSEKTVIKLKNAGMLNVMNLYGGIFEWKNKDLPLTDSNGELTDKLHAFDKKWGIWLQNGEKVYTN